MSELKSVHLFVQSIGSIEFDTLISENHNSSITLTEYPIESGAPVTDHFFRNNNTVVLNIGHGLIPFLTNVNGEPDALRLSAFYGKLYEAMTTGELFELQTGIKLYTNMAIVNLACVRDNRTATVVNAIVNMREIRVVDVNETTEIKKRYSELVGVRTRAGEKVKRNDSATLPVTPKEADKLESIGVSSLKTLGILQ